MVRAGAESTERRWLVIGLIAAAVAVIAVAFSDVALELALAVAVVVIAVLLARQLGARSTRWQWVPLASALAAAALVAIPTLGVTQLLAVLTVIPTAVAWRKIRRHRALVFYVGSLLDVVVIAVGLALLLRPA
ncbi:MAG TPA: hypothetical protein VGJ58_13585 [Gaiellaceae bacterium]|jgi:hypothetical protein